MAICPNCGEDNPDKAKFCQECATPLKTSPPTQAEERKVVSILFVDLVDFTARSHDADPEDVRATLAPYHQRVKREIEAYGGVVEKFIGDAVMAVFGAPVAHEDDAERAVRAALRIVEGIEELNEANPTLDLSIRAAVNTGEGLVKLAARPQAGEGLVTGDVVNTASRLQNVAPVGGVVVGEITYRSTKDIFDYQDLEAVAVKGKPDPIPIWRPLSARGRFGIDVELPRRTPFVGREFDLGSVRHAFGRTLRERSLQLVTISGEPGVGKSRLLSEFFSFVDDQDELVYWAQGRCLPYGEGITFWALGEVIKAQAGILESDSRRQALQKLQAAVRVFVKHETEHEWFVARLAPLVGAQLQEGGTAERNEAFTAWRRFLEAVATRNPFVVVIEDLHWADSALLDFMDALMAWSTGVPIFVVCTARPELYEKRPGWGAGLRNYTSIALSPLTDAETAQLLSELLSQTVLPAEVHSALLERAGGNPLYAEEYVRMLSDRGLVQRRGRVVALDTSVDTPMPESVQALIAARLDTLPSKRKALLHNAAVIGKVFWSGAVAALGGGDEEAVFHSLQDLVRKELIRPARDSSVEGQHEYSFWHALIRDVAYAQIPRATRAEKHCAVAGWIEATAGERAADVAEVLVHHLDEADKLLRASGNESRAEKLAEALTRHLVAAGERAQDLDTSRAERHFQRALQLLPEGHPQRASVLIGAGRSCQLRGKLEDAERYLEEAIVEADARADVGTGAEAMVRLSVVRWYRGDTVRGASLVSEAIARLEGLPPGRALASAYTYAAEYSTFAGHLKQGLAQADKALALASALGIHEWAVEARATRGDARCGLGDLAGLGDLREAVRAGLELGIGEATDVAYSALADWLWYMEGSRQAARAYEEILEFSERRGLVGQNFFTRAERLRVLFDIGEWDALLEDSSEVIAWAEAGSSQAETVALLSCAHVRLYRGQLNEAHSLRERFLPLARGIGDLQVLVPALVIAAGIGQARGENALAKSLIAEWEAATTHSDPWRARFLPLVVRALVADDTAKAETLVSGLEVTAARDRHCVLTGRAIVAEARGDPSEAHELHRAAVQCWHGYGWVLEEAQGHLGQGRCLIARRDRAAATEPLQKARAIFSRLGALPLIKETDGYLQQAEAAS
ncbi:MAG: AAA family ATPase [Actinomycetota bacterium]|nr:AAA family ATPase [Actinomycetota bacterium]